MDLLTYDMNP